MGVEIRVEGLGKLQGVSNDSEGSRFCFTTLHATVEQIITPSDLGLFKDICVCVYIHIEREWYVGFRAWGSLFDVAWQKVPVQPVQTFMKEATSRDRRTDCSGSLGFRF